jgi:hypothetical protein
MSGPTSRFGASRLGSIAGWTERIGLGTSIVLVPLHNPMHLEKEVATLQAPSGDRFTLGVGMGWHKDEFDFMGEVEAMLEAGAEGTVVSFADETAMRDFARRHRDSGRTAPARAMNGRNLARGTGSHCTTAVGIFHFSRRQGR